MYIAKRLLTLIGINALVISTLALIFGLDSVRANVGCYTFVNSTSHPVTIRFHYFGPVPENGVLDTTLDPGKSFNDCFSSGTSATAILPRDVFVRPAVGVYNTLIMGDNPIAKAAGTYTISPPVVAATQAPSTPEPLYTVLSSSVQRVAPGCSIFTPCKIGCLGACPVLHIVIKCGPHAVNPNRVFHLSCLNDGHPCNLNDHELFYGLSQFSVGDHCTHPIPA